MKFVVVFEDDPKVDPSIRNAHLPDHLAFLSEEAGTIEAAGPLMGQSGRGCGGLWVLEAETEQDVLRLIHKDPLWETGLRKDVHIYRWKRVFADGRTLLEKL